MGTLVDKDKLVRNPTGPFLTIMANLRVVAGRLGEFFTFSEGDRLKAGIYVRGKYSNNNDPVEGYFTSEPLKTVLSAHY